MGKRATIWALLVFAPLYAAGNSFQEMTRQRVADFTNAPAEPTAQQVRDGEMARGGLLAQLGVLSPNTPVQLGGDSKTTVAEVARVIRKIPRPSATEMAALRKTIFDSVGNGPLDETAKEEAVELRIALDKLVGKLRALGRDTVLLEAQGKAAFESHTVAPLAALAEAIYRSSRSLTDQNRIHGAQSTGAAAFRPVHSGL